MPSVPHRPFPSLRVLVTALWALGLTAHCGDDTTGRSPVAFPVFAQGVRPEATTALGWSVRIDTARLRLGALRWFEGPPVARLSPWERCLGVGLAYAHPGHYVPGEALADITTPVVIDLTRTTPNALGTARGVSGDSRSARIELRPSPVDPALPGATLSLTGTATRAAQTVRFAATYPLVLDIPGVPAPGALDPQGTPWTLQVDLVALVDRVDFAALPPASPSDDPVVFPADSQSANALARALRASATYRVLRSDTP